MGYVLLYIANRPYLHDSISRAGCMQLHCQQANLKLHVHALQDTAQKPSFMVVEHHCQLPFELLHLETI